ncbi:MAG: hybrid sensor histidine kinase/response regulator [Campylobacterota bacterium]|nr:hybrid sensor histidine kinase/response regulator [Campylobacterota bacterium]
MKTILIVDDDIVILKKLEDEIHKQLNDIRLLTANSYKDSIKHILSNDIDMALIDIFIPDVKDGAVVEFALKKNIPTMVITGDDSPTTQDKYIQLPIIEFIQKRSSKSIAHAVKTLSRFIKNHDVNILIVDDSSLQLEKAKRVLEAMKLNITTAMNGLEALDIIENSGIDFSLVLTDYNMPQMDGMELTIRIREKYDKDELGIIVMTIDDEHDIPIKFIKYGANDFIHKPFTLLEMSTRINANLEILDLFKGNAQKEKQILDQAKSSQMGELIGNIAHQWRQPLSVISTAASGMKVQKELGLLGDDEFINLIDQIVNSTQFLSSTIDTFRDYTEEENIQTQVNIFERLKNTIYIVKALLDENKISVIIDFDDTNPIFINTISSELSQALLNIIYNAKDILIEREVNNPYIKVDCVNNDQKIIITIEDNGGGVELDIIDQIFDPYFTTKHKTQGKGLGLYMSKEIIDKQLSGSLYANNTNEGVRFFIELPLS